MRGVSSSCPRRFDAGFVPTAKPDRDAIIVTRNSPLISAVSRKRSGEYLICGGSFLGGGGCREATVDEAVEYLARRPHFTHLMQLTLELEWHGRVWGNYQTTPTVALACDLSFAELNEKQFLSTAPWLNSNFQQGSNHSIL